MLACLAIAAFAAWFSANVAVPNVDVSWLLVVCQRLLEGARLHVDIVEINPPFSVWLYMPFMLAEHSTGLRAETWLSLGVPAFALLSLALSSRILHRSGSFGGAWLAPVALAILLLLSPGDFGQREQLATIALLPWLALLAARDRTPAFIAGHPVEKILAGIGAAVFVMTKPPLAVPALALPVLYLCVVRRSLRPLFTAETLLGAAITLGYVAYLAAYHLTFFVDLMPMLREAYLPVRRSLLDGALLRPVLTLGLGMVVAAMIARPRRLDPAATLLFLAALGYVPAFLIMGKGWSYQALPFQMLGLLALAVQMSRRQSLSERAKAALGTSFVVIIILAGFAHGWSQRPRHAQLAGAREAILRVVEKPTLGSIATELQPAHPLSRMTGATYVSRHPALWLADNVESLIGAGADPATTARLRALSDRVVADTAAELERTRPDVIVDGGSRTTLGHAAVHADPGIARVLDSYVLLYRDSATTVLVRSDIAPAAPAPAVPAPDGPGS